MTPETNLAVLLQSMAPRLSDEVFVFATLPNGVAASSDLQPLLAFQEQEGTTLVLRLADAERLAARATSAAIMMAFPCRLITLTVHSALNAVGFLAAITTTLAAAGISVNAISAFHHDHLLVPADRAEEALSLLRDLSLS